MCFKLPNEARMTHEITSLQRQILDYVRGQESAAETANGVNNVWLCRPANKMSIAEVELALEGLVSRSLLEKHVLPGSTVVYRRFRGPAHPREES